VGNKCKLSHAAQGTKVGCKPGDRAKIMRSKDITIKRNKNPIQVNLFGEQNDNILFPS
jgi:hypothetical protein